MVSDRGDEGKMELSHGRNKWCSSEMTGCGDTHSRLGPVDNLLGIKKEK